MVNQSRVLSLVARWEEAREGGTPLPVEDVCGGSPEYVEPVRQAIHKLHGGLAALSTVTSVTHTGTHSIQPHEVPGFDLLEEIGRGGMGVVYRARDRHLNREIAVKVLQDKYPPRSVTAERFVEEAQITGQLQHPGIPSVYQVGAMADGRPFLAMKLIKGRTLDQVMKDGELNPLAAFEGICQAVAYAHAHRVIHRDLKPANVMVGSFGEVQVMDWGLAKLLAAGSQPDDRTLCEKVTDNPRPVTEIKTRRDADTPFTQYGSVMGTPAYMPPEQAAGESEKVDGRSDVFGLGAILCVLLTGSPPFTGKDVESVRLNAMRGNTADALARLDRCGADPDLVSLCKQCLAFEPGDRPADAGQVAGAVADLRRASDERAKQAELDKAKAEVQAAELWKRRRVWQWAAVAVIVVLALGVAGTTIGLVRAREAEQREKDRANAEGKAKEAEAEQRARAEKAFVRTADVLDTMVSEITGKSLATQRAISNEQKKFLAEVLGYYREFAAETGGDEQMRKRTANAAFRVAEIEYRLGRKEESVKASRTACSEYEWLAAEFPRTLAYRQDLATSHNNLGIVLYDLGKPDAEKEFRRALDIQDELVADAPAVPTYRLEAARTRHNLAALLRERGERTEAQKLLESALDAQSALAIKFPDAPIYRRELAVTHNSLGNLMRDAAQQRQALEQFKKARNLREKLAADFPESLEYRQDLARSHNNVGGMHALLRQWEEGLDQSRKALAIRQQLVVEYPAVPEYRRELARSHHNLGNLLKDSDNPDEAKLEYPKGLGVMERLVADYPAVPAYRVDLGGYYCDYGSLVRDHGKLADAVGWYEKAISAIQPIHEASPRDVRAKLFLRNSHIGLARAYDALRKFEEASQAWNQVVALSSKEQQQTYRLARAGSMVRAGSVAAGIEELSELRKISDDWGANDWYTIACLYSISSSKVNDGQYLTSVAIELLQNAIKAGWKDTTRMKQDTDLDSLRDRDDFKKLLAELDAKYRQK